MTEHVKDNIRYLSFDSLDRFDELVNVFSTRIGGVSTGYYSSMNLGFYNGDDRGTVERNFEIMAEHVLGIRPERIVCSRQTHTTNVVKVTEADCGNQGKPSDRFMDVDGLMTNIPGIALACFYADCVPLYFYDPVTRTAAVSHSGWRGTIKRMGAETVRRMNEEYGCDPKNIYAAIGPSICAQCYEVSSDVADAFKIEFGVCSDAFVLPGKTEDKYQLDLWKANEFILRQAGIEPEHIEISGICTCSNSDWLFSHRATGGKRGNLAAFIMIKDT